MKDLRAYKIPFVGLKNGIHQFDFQIDGEFLSFFENALIEECDVKVDISFDKKETLFVIDFYVDGVVKVACDRCLEMFDKDIFGDYTVYIKFEDDVSKVSDSEDVIYISRSETHLDVSKLIYDYINLSIPIKRTHPEDNDGNSTCDPQILKILESKETESKQEEDPRWAALKKFK